jgi:hypothetical protein
MQEPSLVSTALAVRAVAQRMLQSLHDDQVVRLAYSVGSATGDAAGGGAPLRPRPDRQTRDAARRRLISALAEAQTGLEKAAGAAADSSGYGMTEQPLAAAVRDAFGAFVAHAMPHSLLLLTADAMADGLTAFERVGSLHAAPGDFHGSGGSDGSGGGSVGHDVHMGGCGGGAGESVQHGTSAGRRLVECRAACAALRRVGLLPRCHAVLASVLRARASATVLNLLRKQADDDDDYGASVGGLLPPALAWLHSRAFPWARDVLGLPAAVTADVSSAAGPASSGSAEAALGPAAAVLAIHGPLAFAPFPDVDDGSGGRAGCPDAVEPTEVSAAEGSAGEGDGVRGASSSVAAVRAVQAQAAYSLHDCVRRARMEQLFDCIRDYPESEPALRDLRDALAYTHEQVSGGAAPAFG